MKLSRQNSDSATSYTENSYPFQKNYENCAKKCDAPAAQGLPDHSVHDNSFQELQLLRQLSKSFSENEKYVNPKEEVTADEANALGFPRGRKSTKSNKSNKYMNPVLNEIEPKNRKIDKIVENLKCNQMRSQEVGSIPSSEISQMIGNIDQIDNSSNLLLNTSFNCR